jgi:hypothetical protein
VDFEKTGTREITASQFLKFCTFHRSLLFPVFSLQDTVQNKVCGRKFWAELSKRRTLVADMNKYIKVEDILNEVRGPNMHHYSTTIENRVIYIYIYIYIFIYIYIYIYVYEKRDRGVYTNVILWFSSMVAY